MGITQRVADYFIGRAALPVDTTISNTVPSVAISGDGIRAAQSLPVFSKCMHYLADMINEATPTIVDNKGEVVLEGIDAMPQWLRQPSAEFVFSEWVQQAVWSAITRGVIYNFATLNSNRQPVFMYVGNAAVQNETAVDGAIIYSLELSGGSSSNKKTIKASHVTIRRRFALPGRQYGHSDIVSARTLLETAVLVQDLMLDYYGNNMMLDVVFSLKDKITPIAKKQLLAQIKSNHSGKKRNYRPIFSEAGLDVQRIGTDTQGTILYEMMAYLNTMISTLIFGVDPQVFALKVTNTGQSTLTYVNATHLRSQVWLQACAPIVKLIEGVISDYLPANKHFVLRPTELLRGSPADRSQLATNMALINKHSGVEVFSSDEIREVLRYNSAVETPAITPTNETENV